MACVSKKEKYLSHNHHDTRHVRHLINSRVYRGLDFKEVKPSGGQEQWQLTYEITRDNKSMCGFLREVGGLPRVFHLAVCHRTNWRVFEITHHELSGNVLTLHGNLC